MALIDRCKSLLFVLVLGGVTSGAALAQTIYHRGNDADPETLDPHKTSTVAEANLVRDLYEGLVIHNGQGRVVPGAAESWTVSADGKVYTFKLRASGKWSNGAAVTAKDFVFSFRRIVDPKTGAKYASIIYPIAGAERINTGKAPVETLGVKAVDDRTLEITLENATPYFLELLTHQTPSPVNEASVSALGADFIKAGNLVSNGAYMLKENLPNTLITLVKNPHFHDAANVRIDQVNYIPIKDTAAGVRRFIAGEILSMNDIPADQLKALRTQLGSQVNVAPLLGTYYIAFNTKKPPFDDKRVRTALAMAVDREVLSEEIWAGTLVPAYSFVPPGTANYGNPGAVAWQDQSVIEREETARKLLAEAGFGPSNPLKVELRYNVTDNNKATAVALAGDWKRIGVDTSFISTDARTHFAFLREKGAYDIARAGWIADYNDPQNFLFLFEGGNGGLNYPSWAHAKYDALMKSAARELNLAARAGILREAETLLLAEAPVAPLLFYTNRILISPKLSGFTPNLRGANATRFMSIRN